MYDYHIINEYKTSRLISTSGDGDSCSDIDECAVRVNNCHPNADCTNTFGSFDCSCKSGYSGNGTYCENIDECLQKPCAQNATCFDTHGILYFYLLAVGSDLRIPFCLSIFPEEFLSKFQSLRLNH